MDWLPTSIPGNAKTHAGARTSSAPLGADKPSGQGLVHFRNLRGRWKDREAKRRKTFLMKRANNLFPKLVSEENLRLAIFAVNVTHRFHPHHRPNRTVARVEADVDRYVKELRLIYKVYEKASTCLHYNPYSPNPYTIGQDCFG